MSYVLTAILLFILYRFVVGFVIPIARTSFHIKRQFDQAKQHMEDQVRQHQHSHSVPGEKRAEFDLEGEYIQFEEVKE